MILNHLEPALCVVCGRQMLRMNKEPQPICDLHLPPKERVKLAPGGVEALEAHKLEIIKKRKAEFSVKPQGSTDEQPN